MAGRGVALRIAATCALFSRQSPLYTYGGRIMSPCAPASATACTRLTASKVERAEIAATTGTEGTAATRVRTSEIFSSKVSVAASPSEPRHTMPEQRLCTSHWAWRATNAWSILRSVSKAVVMAGITPFHCIGAPRGNVRAAYIVREDKAREESAVLRR